ncbi:MAG: pentapeptide repeat-containing protein [Alphaproteobacteria bacterium]|nr:pentapeptide repeat-containing protein [Alphaproteobacteria bacterium]
MSKKQNKIAKLQAIRDKTLAQMAADNALPATNQTNIEDESWHAVSNFQLSEDLPLLNIEFNGKNLENGEFDNENLQDADFSYANLSGVNFSGSDLRGADFSGANLTNTNLSKANLSGATFSGAQLIGTNFTGATLNNVIFTEAKFQDAILLDVEIDDITMEELQQLIEYVAKYHPEKLDLTKINLTLLDLKKIDLRRVSLRGVDFTGVDFTGINIMELDLSSCIITPEQIAQALGHPPTAIELKKILAPKKNKKKSKSAGIDLTELFLGNNKEFGVWNVGGFKGMDAEQLVKFSKKIYSKIHKSNGAPVKDKETMEYIREQNRANKEELRKVIEERKRRELANRRREKQINIPTKQNGNER